jgi:hypothetical protein
VAVSQEARGRPVTPFDRYPQLKSDVESPLGTHEGTDTDGDLGTRGRSRPERRAGAA